MSKVADASTADGSTGFFKIYENGWAAANKGAADNDQWGVKDMNVSILLNRENRIAIMPGI